MKCPCKDCDRKGCGEYHGKCEPYQAFVREREKENAYRCMRTATAYSDHPGKRYAIRKKMKESIK